jgi:hypothetical protein
VTVLGLFAAAFLSSKVTEGGTAAASFVMTAVVLAILEIALSFDNAVVNANRLETMTEIWRQRFLTWGILIAVFGMRVVFPLAVVSIAAWISPLAALELALHDPSQYAEVIKAAHLSISAFGSVFLMLVALSFFGSSDPSTSWLPRCEMVLRAVGRRKSAQPVVVLLIAASFSLALPSESRLEFLSAAGCGALTFLTVEGLARLLDGDASNVTVARAGIGGFLYLEVIDASFSFDGVVGAFALTSNLFLIAIGLGIGAMYVRAFTIILVEKRTLSTFIYLEHGAFFSVLVLSAALLLQSVVHFNELLTGVVSVSIIAAAFWSSLRAANRSTVKA